MFTLLGRAVETEDSRGSVCITHSGEMNECLRAEMSEMTSNTKLERRRGSFPVESCLGLDARSGASGRWQHREEVAQEEHTHTYAKSRRHNYPVAIFPS